MCHNILLVDTHGVTRIELGNMLKNLDINIITAKDEIEVLNLLGEGKTKFNAIVWAINSVDFDAFTSIKRVKAKETNRNIPLVIISKYADRKNIIKAIEAGAVEYIAKPYDEETVIKKFLTIFGLPTDNEPKRRLEDDFITFNFVEMFNREIKSASRGGHPLSIMLATAVREQSKYDDESSINEATEMFIKVIKTKLRETDTVFNYNNNCIALLLPFTDKQGLKVVERKLDNVFKSHTLIKQKGKGYTLALASVSFPEDGKIKEKLLDKLEKCLKENIKAIKLNIAEG